MTTTFFLQTQDRQEQLHKWFKMNILGIINGCCCLFSTQIGGRSVRVCAHACVWECVCVSESQRDRGREKTSETVTLLHSGLLLHSDLVGRLLDWKWQRGGVTNVAHYKTAFKPTMTLQINATVIVVTTIRITFSFILCLLIFAEAPQPPLLILN